MQIEGFPVVEIGPYCFAQNQRSQPADARFWSVDGRGPAAYPHPIAGDFVQGVTLPAGVRALHNAAFYNCRKLEWLCAGSALESVGSDLFTNCRALDRFILDAAPDAPTGLKKLVAAVSADIGAVFAPGGAVQAKVFYPEYFEFLDENTPAHIFNHSIEGEGYVTATANVLTAACSALRSMTRLSPRHAWAKAKKHSAALRWTGCVSHMLCCRKRRASTVLIWPPMPPAPRPR